MSQHDKKMLNTVLSIVVPLFILMDFLGTIPVFIALTRDYTPRERRQTAIVSSLIACGIVLLFALTGHPIMAYFGLSIPALKVGGGVLLLYIAFEMIFSGQLAYEHTDKTHITVSPLAIPMLAGPGSMSFAMIAFTELQGSRKALVPLAIGLVWIAGAGVLLGSSALHRLLGKEFVRGLEKVTAVILAMIASEMIMDGIKRYFF